MSELDDYIKEVMVNTDVIFTSLHDEIRELALELLDEEIYIDKVWFAVTRQEFRRLVASCYANDNSYKVTATWKFNYDSVGKPFPGNKYVLDEIVIEDV